MKGRKALRRARCKRVLVVLNNKLETVDLLREEVYPPQSDFEEGPLQVAVVRWNDLEVYVALQSVVFLHGRSRLGRGGGNPQRPESGISKP
jgi:hypothetical protein